MNNQQYKIHVAETIINQLEEGFKVTINGHKVSIFSYIGAKKPFIFDDNELNFNIPNRKKIIIKLNNKDLYDIGLYDLDVFEYLYKYNDVFVSDLSDLVVNLATKKANEKEIKRIKNLLKKEQLERRLNRYE